MQPFPQEEAFNLEPLLQPLLQPLHQPQPQSLSLSHRFPTQLPPPHIAAPRILKQNFPHHQYQRGAIVGKLVSIQQDSIVLLVHHQKMIHVQIYPDENGQIRLQDLEDSKNWIIEVVATVKGDKMIMMEEWGRWSQTFDLRTFNSVVRLMNEDFTHLFGKK